MKKRSTEYWQKRFLDIEEASNAYGQDAFRQIESIEYKYKDGMGPQDGKHVGTTAQSWEGTVFDDAVKENPEGIKELDKNKMLEAGLAGVASLRKDVDDMITSDEGCKEAKQVTDNNLQNKEPGVFISLSRMFDNATKGE